MGSYRRGGTINGRLVDLEARQAERRRYTSIGDAACNLTVRARRGRAPTAQSHRAHSRPTAWTPLVGIARPGRDRRHKCGTPLPQGNLLGVRDRRRIIQRLAHPSEFAHGDAKTGARAGRPKPFRLLTQPSSARHGPTNYAGQRQSPDTGTSRPGAGSEQNLRRSAPPRTNVIRRLCAWCVGTRGPCRPAMHE